MFLQGKEHTWIVFEGKKKKNRLNGIGVEAIGSDYFQVHPFTYYDLKVYQTRNDWKCYLSFLAKSSGSLQHEGVLLV